MDPLCNGGTGAITVTATAPSGTVLEYILDGGTPQSSNVFTDVAAGTHTIRVESVPFVAGFCAVRTVNVTEPAAIVLSISTTPAECLTNVLGTITVSATGGVGAFTFALDGTTVSSTGSSYTFTNVTTGTHEVTVTDANGCSISVEVSVALVRGTTGNPLTDFISAKFCNDTCSA